jgi:hypothetical protein
MTQSKNGYCHHVAKNINRGSKIYNYCGRIITNEVEEYNKISSS